MPLQQPISTISGPTGGPLGRDRENTFNSIKNQGSAPSPLGNLGSPQGSQPPQGPQAPQGPGAQPSIPLVTPQKTTAPPKQPISKADQLGIQTARDRIVINSPRRALQRGLASDPRILEKQSTMRNVGASVGEAAAPAGALPGAAPSAPCPCPCWN